MADPRYTTKDALPSKDVLLEFARHLPFFKLIGLEVLDIEPGWSKTRISWRPDLTQPAGILHGSVVASLIDTGIAYALFLTDRFQTVRQEKGTVVTVDLRVKYFRPVSEGTLVCESTISRMGRQIIHGESVVTNDEGKEVARGDSIYMAVPGTQFQKKS